MACFWEAYLPQWQAQAWETLDRATRNRSLGSRRQVLRTKRNLPLTQLYRNREPARRAVARGHNDEATVVVVYLPEPRHHHAVTEMVMGCGVERARQAREVRERETWPK